VLDWGYRPNVRQDHDHTNNLRSHEMDFSWPWPCGGTSALIRAIGGAHGGVSRLWRGFQLGNALGKGDDDVVLPAALFPAGPAPLLLAAVVGESDRALLPGGWFLRTLAGRSRPLLGLGVAPQKPVRDGTAALTSTRQYTIF
jgi:hypothetical protein